MRKRIFNILILLLFALLLQGGWGRAQDVLIVPHDATSLTEEQKNSNPTILFYPLHMMGKMPEMRCHVEEPLPDTITHDYVDLGLSVLWATCNVGATKPEDYGDYFAWGETEPKETYSLATYKWCQGTANTFTKYCSNSQYGNADYKTILDPEDDAAIVHWGSDWRMPTIDEWLELKQKCSWKKIIINGITGYQVTAKNGNSIFLPRAGLRMSDRLSANDSVGYYASSSHLPRFLEEDYAAYMLMYDNSIGKSSAVRYYGLTIRPVRPVEPMPKPGRCIGVFSVAKDKQVSFSQGNLQYTQSTDTWRFAENQYDYIGEENVKDGVLADKIDLFGWSGEGSNAPFGVSTSTNNADYAGEFVDWGTNIIQGDAANTWRTLSREEWEYLIKGRKNASNLRAAAQVNGVNGMILLPDDWECPEGIDFKAGYPTSKGSEYYAEYQQFTKEQWRELETTGAIFLPAAGMHDGNGIADIQAGGYYWSATDNGDTYAYTLISQSSGAYLTHDNRYDVRSVRLVHDTIVPPPAPCQTFEVNGVTFNMMCVEGGTFMMGAMEGDKKAKDDEKPAHKVTLTYDYHIMQTEVTQGLWEAVMGEDIYVAKTNMENAPNPAYVGADYPMYYVRMNDALEFIDKLNAMTGMHFRLPTEAEWEYAARGGNKSKGYLYAGSNNADDVGWYTGRGGLHRVAQLKPNELGIYDMSGNVSEMCLDYGTYGETYKAGDAVNPRGNIRSNGNRFWRGGSYTHSKDSMRVSQRSSYTPSWGGTWLGLRLVLAEDNDFRTIRVGNSYFDMSFVKGGTFMMGSDAPGAEADEQPVHKVSLSDYYIGQTEVTQHLWKKVMGDDNNPSAVKGNNLPVTNITWNEAQTFVERLSELTGMHFRLPTEAEWEYAARGGKNSRGYTYAGSNSIDSVAWYQANSQEQTHTIATLMPNELGIYDMSGNVWEWCSDWHMPYSAQAQTNPTGAATGEKHVLRGGCYHYDSKNCTNTNRHSYYTPDKGGASTGLRIVLEE